MADKAELIREKFGGLEVKNFYPETYRLDILSDLIGFINSPNNGLWIKKPYSKKSDRLHILRNSLDAFRNRLFQLKKQTLGKFFAKKMFDKKVEEEKTEEPM